jgi:hypothetical protein
MMEYSFHPGSFSSKKFYFMAFLRAPVATANVIAKDNVADNARNAPKSTSETANGNTPGTCIGLNVVSVMATTGRPASTAPRAISTVS